MLYLTELPRLAPKEGFEPPSLKSRSNACLRHRFKFFKQRATNQQVFFSSDSRSNPVVRHLCISLSKPPPSKQGRGASYYNAIESISDSASRPSSSAFSTS